MKISVENFINTLPISLYGILGIFLVMIVVFFCTLGLCKLLNKSN